MESGLSWRDKLAKNRGDRARYFTGDAQSTGGGRDVDAKELRDREAWAVKHGGLAGYRSLRGAVASCVSEVVLGDGVDCYDWSPSWFL